MLFLSSLITYSQTEIDGIMMSKNNFCTEQYTNTAVGITTGKVISKEPI